MPVDADLLAWLEDAVKSADSWESVVPALQAHDPDGNDLRLRPFVFAFGYAFHEGHSTARERAGGAFGAMVSGDGWRFPPALADIEDADLDAWRDALAAVPHHVAQAR